VRQRLAGCRQSGAVDRRRTRFVRYGRFLVSPECLLCGRPVRSRNVTAAASPARGARVSAFMSIGQVARATSASGPGPAPLFPPCLHSLAHWCRQHVAAAKHDNVYIDTRLSSQGVIRRCWSTSCAAMAAARCCSVPTSRRGRQASMSKAANRYRRKPPRLAHLSPPAISEGNVNSPFDLKCTLLNAGPASFPRISYASFPRYSFVITPMA
jgi:hypothetical protein